MNELEVDEQGRYLSGDIPYGYALWGERLIEVPAELDAAVTAGRLTQTEATKILKSDPRRSMALLAKEYPTMTPETNEQAYATVSQIWPMSGQMTEAQARATFSYLQPEGPVPVDFPSTFTNEFLPK